MRFDLHNTNRLPRRLLAVMIGIIATILFAAVAMAAAGSAPTSPCVANLASKAGYFAADRGAGHGCGEFTACAETSTTSTNIVSFTAA